jgi:hypothetical protein
MEMYLIAGDWSSLYNVEGCGRGCYILRGCLRAGNLRLWLSIRLYVLNIPLEEHLAGRSTFKMVYLFILGGL